MITSAWVVKNVTIQYCTHPDDHIQTSLIYFKSVFSKSYGDLIYFEFGRNFRLEILMGWGEAETEYNFIILFVWFVFVYMFLPQEPENVQFYLHFPNKESAVWMKTYSFVLPISNAKK